MRSEPESSTPCLWTFWSGSEKLHLDRRWRTRRIVPPLPLVSSSSSPSTFVCLLVSVLFLPGEAVLPVYLSRVRVECGTTEVFRATVTFKLGPLGWVFCLNPEIWKGEKSKTFRFFKQNCDLFFPQFISQQNSDLKQKSSFFSHGVFLLWAEGKENSKKLFFKNNFLALTWSFFTWSWSASVRLLAVRVKCCDYGCQSQNPNQSTLGVSWMFPQLQCSAVIGVTPSQLYVKLVYNKLFKINLFPHIITIIVVVTNNFRV